MSELTIKDLIGIDFDDKGLAETIDSVTNGLHEQRAVQAAIGHAIFLDGGLLEEDCNYLNPLESIKSIAFDSDEVMNMICYYASRLDWFMDRLKG